MQLKLLPQNKAYFHLPGLFEFYELYRVFFSLYREHREYFYDWCEIASVYGAPADCRNIPDAHGTAAEIHCTGHRTQTDPEDENTLY